MPSMQQHIELWKTRLLDLSRRNRLLHARPGLSGTVALTQPALGPLFEALAQQRRRLSFAAALTLEQRLAALSWDAPATGVTMRLDQLPVPAPKSGQIVTNLAPTDQERVLYSLRLKARTALNEQGVNILFVALGFLEWYAPDAPEQVWRSPLLLLPVELQRAPLGAEYALRPLDDDVVINPTLVHKLRQDFGIALPELPDDLDELHPEQLFAQIEEAVAAQPGWRVLPEVVLGLFSFLKLLMYHDLERAAAAAEAHPILSLFAAGDARVDVPSPPGSLSAQLAQEPPPLAALDSRAPEDCYQVLDADSSQAEAIEAARAGASFVLQGPPGTGKSQTIANIIAECMAQGKRVLFVSEKMAALQVVFERLKQCGLEQFCLEAHSHKASKRTLLDALGAALDAPAPPDLPSFPYAELAATRAQLNAYATALHAPHGPLRWTPYQVYARMALLRDAPDCAAPLGDLDAYTAERLGAIDTLLARLDSRRELLQALPHNPWRGSAATSGGFELRGQIRTRLRGLLAALAELQSAAAAFAAALGLPAPANTAGIRALQTLALLLGAPWRMPEHWVAVAPPAPGLIDGARAQYERLAQLDDQLAQRHQDSVLGLDLDGLRARFTQVYASWARVLRPQYYRDMALLRASLKPGATLDYSGALADIQRAIELRAARQAEEQEAEQLASAIGGLFQRRATEWEALVATVTWAEQLLALPLPRPFPAALLELLTGQPSARAELALASGGALAQRLAQALAKYDQELAFQRGLQIDQPALRPDAIETAPCAEINTQTLRLLDHMADLDAWWEFCELRRAAEPLGIAEYLDALGADPEAAAQPRRAFYKRFHALWLDAANQRSLSLRQFQRAPHEALVERFRTLDQGQLLATQQRLRQRLSERRPAPNLPAVPGGELANLRRELQKQRRHKPVRQLFREMPGLLGLLKPCLMMSPLSVSQFLDCDIAPFDLVIFDEASQIRTEDAVGAVLRGKALIVVGDNKQLPPTSFFLADAESGDDDEQIDAPESFESILDAASAAGLATRMLRWHYRSRDEALIAFSNAHFYDGRLATFPNAAVAEGHGVSLEYVAGVYDRQGSRTNQIEARRVADLVCERAKASPERSLGVVAFSQPQQLAILHELEHRRAGDPALDALLRSEAAKGEEPRAEPFFVKNLENVQGDERDVMIISVGYGRDAAGRLLMNFGPLNQQGGERRLNVVITRAREQVVLVSSLLAEDIEVRRTQHPGPRLLRDYLDYAQRGGNAQLTLAHSPQPIAPGQRFEDQLAAALAQRGLRFERQIGRSDFRIDIAIHAPQEAEEQAIRYLLGVECDGDDYRDAATARDRERLREQVLGTLGWRIHRAWSAAWAHDPAAELDRVLAALDAAEADLRGPANS